MISRVFITLVLLLCVTCDSTFDSGSDSQLATFTSNDSYIVAYSQYNLATNSTNIIASGKRDNGSDIFLATTVHTILNDTTNQNPSIATLSSTSFLVAWESFGKDGSSTPSWGVSATIIDGSGSVIIPEFSVPGIFEGDQYDPKVAVLNSGFVIVWSSAQDVMIKYFDSTGTNITDDILVGTASFNSTPQVTYHTNSQTVFVVWTNSSQIRGRRLNTSGAFLDSNELSLVSGSRPIIVDVGTNLLLAWESGTDIFQRILNATWQYVSSTTAANQITSGSQSGVQASLLTSGNILMTWQSSGIAARLFSTNGSAVSSEFSVSNTTGTQTQPAVSALRSATCVMTWTDQGSWIVGGIFDTTLQVNNAALNRTWIEDTTFFFNSSAITVSALYSSPVTFVLTYPIDVGSLTAATGSASSNSTHNFLTITGSPTIVSSSLQSLVFAPTANYATTFSILIQVSSTANPTQTYITLMTAVPVNDAPVITKNEISISEGAAVTLGTQNISVSDDTSYTSLSFEVDYVSNGFFSYSSAQAVEILSFTYTELSSGNVLFTHDGSDTPPLWTLVCFDGQNYSAPSNLTILSFIPVNDPPVVATNNFQITENQKMILNNTVLLVTDDMTPPQGIIIWVFDITSGYFVNITSNATITQFTMQDVTSSLVGLQQDGSDNGPSFSLVATDGTFNISISPNVTFVNVDEPPILQVYSPITIYQGGILHVTSDILNATDPDATVPDAQIQFFLSGAGNTGEFYLLLNGNKVLTASATQKNVQDGVVYFQHNNSTNVPFFNVTAYDGIALSPPSSPAINFVLLYNNTNSSTTGTPEDSGDGGNDKTQMIAIAASVVGVAVISLVVSVVLFVKRNNHKNHHSKNPNDPERDPKVSTEMLPTPPRTPLISGSASGHYGRAKASSTSDSAVPSTERTSMNSYWEIDYSEIDIGRELGRGAFGVVYKARWRNSDCVVKQLNLSKTNEEGIQDFLKEAETVKKMRHHPNVCSVFGVCTNRDYPICIVMEYLSGGSLYDYIQKGKLTVDEEIIIQIGKDVASGMSHLHQEGVLHNDLACRNLLVTPKAEGGVIVKVADFGLAKKGQISSLPNQGRLPIRWTAPEVFSTNLVSTAADVWSFGIVIWELYQLELPYGTLSNQQVIEEVGIEGKRLSRPTRIECSDDMWEIIQSCWNESERRPSFNDIYQMLHQIQKYQKQLRKSTGTNISRNTSSDSEAASVSPMQNHFIHYGRSTRQIQITSTNPSDSESDPEPQVTTATTQSNQEEYYNTEAVFPEIKRPFNIANQELTYTNRSGLNLAKSDKNQ